MHALLKKKGFTLIELIVVLVVLSVLGVSLASRFFTMSGTSEYLYQDQILNLLRRAQMQAMQCTDCVVPSVSLSEKEARLGTASCENADTSMATTVCVAAREAVSFSPAGTISFNSLGQPTCTTSCTIAVESETTLRICIETEGYIHPC
ncbi:MAG TPA: prepilin-type N-terminal cleavage/methylation domain-containing protein [Rheinheimera sp.]|uniref:prepilin-type N-terminal cleavage/methylation domain-containing protein n=1 Tax=Rheinheimera sp. TaxID=1869214 RepID=UPI002F9383C7